jgi:hypothetical protein
MTRRLIKLLTALSALLCVVVCVPSGQTGRAV